MKKILLAMAIMIFAGYGAQAQCKCPPNKKTATRRHRTTTHAAAVKTDVTKKELCRVVPYTTCKIMPGRKTVSCYKTTDLESFTPLNDEVTYFGPQGRMPNEVYKPTIKTYVVTGPGTADNCKKNIAGKTTVCSYSGVRFYRDMYGNYSYRDDHKYTAAR